MSKYKNEEDMMTPPIDTFIDKNVMSNQLLKKHVDNTTMNNLILDLFKNKKENQMGQYNNEDINMDSEQIAEILRQRKMAEESALENSNPNLINRTPDSLSKEEIENSLGSVYKTLGIKKPTPTPRPIQEPEMSLAETLKKYYTDMLQPKAGDTYAPSEALGKPNSNYMNSNAPFAGVEHNVFPKTKQKLKRIDLNPDGSHKSFHFDTSGSEE